MKWDRGWHGQENRWVDVHEALELRDSGTLKTGDLFCCHCENTRLSPVDSVVRVKHLRMHSKHRKEANRVLCNKIRKAIEKGESWKYSRVVDAIVHYLETDAKSKLKIDSVELGRSKEEPDIIVTHSETFQGFESDKSYIIVPFQNLRRSTKLFNRHSPNSVAVEIHRYRDKDVDFIQYIRERVDKAYEICSNSSLSPEFLHSSTNIPNMGLWSGKTGGLGRGLTLKVGADTSVDSEEHELLSYIERMIDVVEEHNMWAISTPGMHRYHLKNLKFQDYATLGNHHPDASIDAMCSFFDPLQMKQEKNNVRKFFQKSNNDWYDRAVKGQDEAIQEGIQEIKEAAIRAKDKAIKKLIEGGMQSELAHKIGEDAALESISSVQNEVLTQIEFDKNVAKSAAQHRNNFSDEIGRTLHNNVRDLFKQQRITFDTEDDSMKIISEYGEIIIDAKSASLNPFYTHLITTVPEIHFWDKILEDEKKVLMAKACRTYRKFTIFRGTPTRFDLLTDLGIDMVPKRLTDTTGIANALEKISDNDVGEFTPISKEDLIRLKYLIWADRDLSFPDTRHHCFVELIRKVYHSTDDITRKVVLNLPQPIEDLLSGEGDADEQIIDLLSTVIVDLGDSEE